MKERVLCVSAHCDDESFGALGTLLKHKAAGDDFAFLWFTQARGTFEGAEKVADYFDAQYGWCDFRDQELDTYPLKKLVTCIENMVNDFKPTIVYCPFIRDLNKDHRLISESTMVSCRPYKFTAPPQVFMYYIPGMIELGFRRFQTDKRNKIDAKKKKELLRLWYPQEMINGRETVSDWEYFEKWPSVMI